MSANPDIVVKSSVNSMLNVPVTDSSTRHGHFIMQANDAAALIPYMPHEVL